jgi:MoaA/NifB/PqqE/SkfB family radical SAM enzyme
MFKVYQEHENFGLYSAFDLALGKMQLIDKESFDSFGNNKLKFINTSPSPFHTRFPRRIYFQITRSCQLSCDYCYVKAGPKQPHLEQSVILEMANFMGKNGLMEVRLTGGEATVHPNFIEICEHFHKNNIYISLGTNGLWSEPIKEFLAAQPYFCLAITIDGSELTHGAYRKGTHKSLLKNINDLRKKNSYIRIRINMVVTKSNKQHYQGLVDFAKDVSAESLTFLPLRPRLNAPELLNEVLSASEFREIANSVSQYRIFEKQKIQQVQSATINKKDDPFAIFKNRKVCPTGRERMNLSFHADTKQISAFACTFSPAMDNTVEQKIRDHFIAGKFSYENIDQLLDIWNDNDRWEIFRDRDLKQKACSSCSSFGKSCGGTGFCHIQNHEYYKLNTTEDIKQQLRKQMLNLPTWCELPKKNMN